MPKTPQFLKQLKQNRYLVINTLGQGGMGIVQLVQDQWLNRKIALKRIIKKDPFAKKPSTEEEYKIWRLPREATFTKRKELKAPEFIHGESQECLSS